MPRGALLSQNFFHNQERKNAESNQEKGGKTVLRLRLCCGLCCGSSPIMEATLQNVCVSIYKVYKEYTYLFTMEPLPSIPREWIKLFLIIIIIPKTLILIRLSWHDGLIECLVSNCLDIWCNAFAAYDYQANNWRARCIGRLTTGHTKKGFLIFMVGKWNKN